MMLSKKASQKKKCLIKYTSTQNQALSAILFLYKNVLGVELPWLQNIKWAKRPEHLLVVFTSSEVKSVLSLLDGVCWIMGNILYGTGLRLMECVRLRVKDVDFEYKQITVRDGKGKKDRVTILPEVIEDPLRKQLEKAKIIHDRDLSEGFGEVYMPYALERKYPKANKEWGWQYVFSAKNRSKDPRSVAHAPDGTPIFAWSSDGQDDPGFAGYGVYGRYGMRPVAVCQNAILILDGDGQATLTPADIDGGSYDPDGDSITFGMDKDTFSCEDLGDNPVTLTVTDERGLYDTCEATVTVVDKVPLACGSIPGDLDDDGDVDGDDRNILRNALRSCSGNPGFVPEADYDDDGCVTYNDYRIWYLFYRDFINP